MSSLSSIPDTRGFRFGVVLLLGWLPTKAAEPSLLSYSVRTTPLLHPHPCAILVCWCFEPVNHRGLHQGWPCAIACIYICAHVKHPVTLVRVRWIMKTLKHPACEVGWVARLCRSWLSRRKETRISQGRTPEDTIDKNKKKKKKCCNT